jgi:carbon-monoxide dehydrogenase small subunit
MAEPEAPQPMSGASAIPDFAPAKTFGENFTVPYPPDRVFDMLGDVRQVAACLPGASLTDMPTPERVEGAIRVKLGPISADFLGAARIERDVDTLSGRIVGIGSDQRSRSSTQGEIRYRLVPSEQGAATRVELSIGYSLKGMLAQIARDGLVRDLAARLTADFARNLDRHLSGKAPPAMTEGRQELDGMTMLIDILRKRVSTAIRQFLAR